VGVATIVEGVPLHSGDPTWQAEIYVPQGMGANLNHSGRVRTMCIRGPSRASKDQALRDAKQLEVGAAEGPKAVRTIANQMQRTKKGHDLDRP